VEDSKIKELTIKEKVCPIAVLFYFYCDCVDDFSDNRLLVILKMMWIKFTFKKRLTVL